MAAKAVRLAGLLWLGSFWAWHFSPTAQQVLPAAVKFGWHFRYLTFNSLTLQVIQLATCVAHDVLGPRAPWLKQIADDLSCVLFPLATTVTLLYHGLNYLVPGAAREAEVIFLVDFSAHVVNSAVMWTDMLLSKEERTFSRRASYAAITLSFAYTTWLTLIKRWDGSYPYPILEMLSPRGVRVFKAGAIGFFSIIFHTGRVLSPRGREDRRLRRSLRQRAKAA